MHPIFGKTPPGFRLLAVAWVAAAALTWGQANHLLISEILYDAPTENSTTDTSEFIEIFNPTTTSVQLGDSTATGTTYFISDMSLEFYEVTTPGAVTGASGQFCYEFPHGTTLPPGGVIVISGSEATFAKDFFNNNMSSYYNLPGNPQFLGIAQMKKIHTFNSVNLSLTNGSSTGGNIDNVYLYSWDKSTNRVRDHDFVGYNNISSNYFWLQLGRPNPPYGPDGNTLKLANHAINPISGTAADTLSITRINQIELSEVTAAGNGFGGHDETTEDLTLTFQTLARSPGVVHANLTGGLTLFQPAQAVIVVSGTLKVGATITCSGTNSSGQIVSYLWDFVSVPQGSALTGLSNPTLPTATFVPDVDGTYEVELSLDDGVNGDVATATIVVSPNDPPVAIILGPAVTSTQAPATLDGSTSYDPDNSGPLSYQWSLTVKPANSTATLSATNTPTVDITPDKQGNYTVQLIVNDGIDDSAPTTFTFLAAASGSKDDRVCALSDEAPARPWTAVAAMVAVALIALKRRQA